MVLPSKSVVSLADVTVTCFNAEAYPSAFARNAELSVLQQCHCVVYVAVPCVSCVRVAVCLSSKTVTSCLGNKIG